MSDHAIKEVVVNGTSSVDEPSVEWGWHGTFRFAMHLLGWGFALFLLAMLIGNHTGNVENIWLIVSASIIAIGLVLDLKKNGAPKKGNSARPAQVEREEKIWQVKAPHYTLNK